MKQEVIQSTVGKVIAAIKENIREGRFVPGQRLVEPDLMKALKVSRGSVREALQRLESEGLIELKPFTGATIRKMSKKEVAEFNEIRELLEGLAARLAAERITAKSKKTLIEIEKSFDAKNARLPYTLYNLHFHNAIISMSGHPHLSMFLERTQLGIIQLQFQKILETQSVIAKSRSEHDGITAAILKGDAKSAERLMRLHIQNSTKQILQGPDYLFAES